MRGERAIVAGHAITEQPTGRDGAMPAEVQASDRNATINGLRLHFRDWGGETPLSAIAVHGFALNAHSFDEVAPALNDQLRVFAV